ncbi:MAG: hypothetical protein ACJAQT_004580 [Akkermansiaceae bacterium]
MVFFDEFERSLGGEAEADGEWGFTGNPVADSQNVGFEDLEGFSPGFSGMNIGAVGEVVAVKLHVGYIA